MNKKTDNINYSIGLLGKCSYVVRSINNKVSAVVETFMFGFQLEKEIFCHSIMATNGSMVVEAHWQ
jgi:hypothetical protein